MARRCIYNARSLQVPPLVGLGITVTTVELMGRLGVEPIASKAVAIGISFVAVYAMRKWGVFR